MGVDIAILESDIFTVATNSTTWTDSEVFFSSDAIQFTLDPGEQRTVSVPVTPRYDGTPADTYAMFPAVIGFTENESQHTDERIEQVEISIDGPTDCSAEPAQHEFILNDDQITQHDPANIKISLRNDIINRSCGGDCW